MEDWAKEALDVYNDFVNDGFSITVRVPGSPGVFNASTLKYVGATEDTDHETYGIKKNYDIRQIDGKIIQSGDTMLYFPAYGLPTITSDNQILINSIALEVVSLKTVDPGNVPLIYLAQVRS